jgi:hypothetical protein
MLLDAVKVTNSQGSVLNLPLEDPSAGFVVRNIDGLGPVKATLVSSSFANMDGGQYHSARREPRNIVLTLGLEPDYAFQGVQALRDQLYQFFMPKSKATLDFHMFDKFTQNIETQTKDLIIEARIEDFDSALFTKDPTAVISMMCYDPDFVDPRLIEFNGPVGTSLVEQDLYYEGTVETGVLFNISPNEDLSDFTIYHRPPDGTLVTIDFSYPILAGESVQISSVPGSKYVTLWGNDNVEKSILYAVSPQSGWLELQPGHNKIRVYAVLTDPIGYNIEYTNKYGGL